jgi:hypothetical protein
VGSIGTALLRRIVHEVETDRYRPNVDLDDIVAAHRYR